MGYFFLQQSMLQQCVLIFMLGENYLYLYIIILFSNDLIPEMYFHLVRSQLCLCRAVLDLGICLGILKVHTLSDYSQYIHIKWC